MIANGYWVGFFLSDENVLELEMMVHDFAKILNPLMCTLHKAELYGIQIISQLKKKTRLLRCHGLVPPGRDRQLLGPECGT